MKERIRSAYDDVRMTDTQKKRVLNDIWTQGQKRSRQGRRIALAAGLTAVIIAVAVAIPLLTGSGESPDQVAAADTAQTHDDQQTDTAPPTHDGESLPDNGIDVSPGGVGISLPDDLDITESIDFTGRWRLASVIESGKTNMVCIVSESGEDDIDDDYHYCGIEHLAPYRNSSRYIIIEYADPSYPTVYEVYEIIPDRVMSTAGENPRIIDTSADDMHYIEHNGITVGLYAGGYMLIYKQTLPNGNVQFYATDVTGADSQYDMPYVGGYYDKPFQRIFEYERADKDITYVCMAKGEADILDEEVPNIGEVLHSGMVYEFMQNGKDGEYMMVGMRIYADRELAREVDFVYNGKTITQWADAVHEESGYYDMFGDFKFLETEAYLEAFDQGEFAIEDAYREFWISQQSDQDVVEETLYCVDNLGKARRAYVLYRRDCFSELAFAECVRLREAGYDVGYQPPDDDESFGFAGEMKGALTPQQIRNFPAGDCGYILFAYGMHEGLDE